MNYKRDEATSNQKVMIFCVFIIIIATVYLMCYKNYNDKLLQENLEYLSIIEEYSVEYSKLEDKIKSYKSEIKDYKAQIKEYEEKLETTTEATTTKKVTTTRTSSNTNSFTGNITAYCGCSECCGQYATDSSVKYGASGMKLISGYSVASDYYAMGTILYIEGYGKVQVADRFGAGHGKSRIDIYFDSHSTALQWGRQYRNVSVVS